MTHFKLVAQLAVFILLTGFFSGCSTTPLVKERYFWPPPPDTPRIEWLGAYQSQLDVEPTGGLLNLITGGDEAYGLRRPTYIGADGKGKVYVSDYGQQSFIVFDIKAKHIHSLGREKALGIFGFPSGIALDGEGNIYAADSMSRKIYVFDTNENIFAVIDLSKELVSIASIAIDKQRKHLIIPDVKGHKVLVYDISSGTVLQTLGYDDKAPADINQVRFNYPTSAAVAKNGNFWICDSMNARILHFSPEGKLISEFGNRGDALGDFNIIKAAAVDSEGHVYVTDAKAHRISIFDEKGQALLVFGGPYAVKSAGSEVKPGGFLLPNGIFIDQNDTIYIVDQMNGRFQVFQYVNERYLKEHPITNQAPAAKAVIRSNPSVAPVPALNNEGGSNK